MIDVHIAKSPDLSFLLHHNKDDCDLPFITNDNGDFHWLANDFITSLSGGASIYGVKPKPSSIIPKARSLGLFLNYMYSQGKTEILTTDKDIFEYCDYLQTVRKNNNDTLKRHVRTALQYLCFAQESDLSSSLITSESKPEKQYQVHITIEIYRGKNFQREYIQHDSILNLTESHGEVEIIYDDEFFYWLDAINCSSNHPEPDELIIARWESLSFLLDETGPRISELHLFTRQMIKDAYVPLADADEQVELKNISITKGKYKGKKRKVSVANGTIQYILSYIELIENKWPHMNHDRLFVDVTDGSQLSAGYFKNYTRRVIDGSKYAKQLSHVSNHTFRHRFITLRVAESIDQLRERGNFTNILSVAMTAVRKLTLHASNETMSTYVHLAIDYLERKHRIPTHTSAPQRVILYRIRELLEHNKQGKLNDADTVHCINEEMSKAFAKQGLDS